MHFLDMFTRYDEGSIMVKVGREEPAVSMDASGGKIIWARHSEVQQANLKAMGDGAEIKDGERLPLAVKDMGSCDIYPQTIAHNPNGRLVSLCVLCVCVNILTCFLVCSGPVARY